MKEPRAVNKLTNMALNHLVHKMIKGIGERGILLRNSPLSMLKEYSNKFVRPKKNESWKPTSSSKGSHIVAMLLKTLS